MENRGENEVLFQTFLRSNVFCMLIILAHSLQYLRLLPFTRTILPHEEHSTYRPLPR